MKNNDICPYYKYCGGCSFQGTEYKKQLEKKQEYINKLLSKYHKVNKIIGMGDPLNYRNKIQVSFGYDAKHNVIYGNYIPSTHAIVEIDDCMLADKKSLEIISYIKKLIIKYHITIFDEDSLKGVIRHVQIRNTSLNEYMVILVVGTYHSKKLEVLVNDLRKKYKEIKTIIQNINNRHTSMVLGDKNVVLYGKGYIEDTLCGLKFKLSPSSFYQVNKRQTEILYSTAINLAGFDLNDVVIDAYSGIGTISLIVSKYVKSVIGVEINKAAIKDAIYNSKLNKIDNSYFVCDDAGRFMNKYAKDKKKVDFVIMDPPRSGADDKFLSSLIRLKPRKILYISCGPESLKNNLKYLTKNNYAVKEIQPIDMFPFTEHVECIVVLQYK